MLAEQRAAQAEREPLEQELAQLERKLQRAQRMCLDEAISTTDLKDSSTPLKQRQGEIQGRLAQAARTHQPRPIVAAAASAYAAMAESLQVALAEAGGEAIRNQTRELVERADFIPLEGLGRFDLRVHGKLAALLGMSEEASGGMIDNGCGDRI